MREMLLEIRDSVRRLEGRFDGVDQRFDGLEGRFNGLEGRFDKLEGRFDKLEGRFDGLEGRFDKLEGRFDGLEQRFDGLEGRFDGLTGQFKGLAMEFVKFEDRITRRFDSAVSEMKEHYRYTVEAAEAARDARRKVLTGPEVYKIFKGDLNDHEKRILELERKTRSLPEA